MEDNSKAASCAEHPSKPRPKSRSQQRCQHLLTTARRLFAEQGFHQSGMSQIARESGIAVGQIYRDFANKEAIIAAICEESLQVWLAEETVEQAIAAGDHAAIRRWIEHLLVKDSDFEMRRMLVEILAETGRNPLIAQLNATTLERFRRVLGMALDALIPGATPACKVRISDFSLVLCWGVLAGEELIPGLDGDTFRTYVAALLEKEIDRLAALPEGHACL